MNFLHKEIEIPVGSRTKSLVYLTIKVMRMALYLTIGRIS